MEKSVWDLLCEPLEFTLWVRTNNKQRPIDLVCPTKEQMEQLYKDVPEFNEPEVEVPLKEVVTFEGKKRKVVKEPDMENADYVKARDERAKRREDRDTLFALNLLDLGIKSKPEGDLETRLSVYKKIPNPVLQKISNSIQYLILHETPPYLKDDEDKEEDK